MSTLGTVGSTIGGAVVNAAAVAAAIVILRSGKAGDPKLIAGAMAIYVSAKRSGQLNGELFGNKLVDVGSYFNGSADASDLESAISGTVTIKAGKASADFSILSKPDNIPDNNTITNKKVA